MRKLFIYTILTFIFSSSINASSLRNQIYLLEASENIRMISQEIVKNYLYYYYNHEKKKEKEAIYNGIKLLDAQFRIIAKSTKDEDSKDILTFLDYSKDKIEKILLDPFNKDNPALMIDYSEVLLEGAETISKNLKYKPSDEEKILIKMKDISFLIDRVIKYYMALLIEPDNISYQDMLNSSMKDMEKDLNYINTYNYSPENISHIINIERNWSVLNSFLEDVKESRVPNIVLLISSEVKKNAKILENYHRKNQ
ncbi:Nitric oxide-responding transcriptional regulator Dnr (Crp/Fnr family) [hydrothermal vent metagenome]|uniref:Nitric oxide-responding transcriptional regulator Dnr (Crp/Fnr family) n=1 Tax=hydrothermal vent metagenome TaxID=652676 RepID=A0A1W1BRL4_9ZZZZ